MKKKTGISGMDWYAWTWMGILLLLAITTNGIFQGIGVHKGSLIIYYEKPVMYSVMLSLIVLVWIVAHFYQKNFQFERRMIYAAIASVICLVYIVSSFNAESPFLSHIGVLISLVIYIFFVAGTFLIQYDKVINLFPKVYLIFGYIIVIYGFLNLLGNIYLLDSLSFINGVRITSIFQYANSYAVLLLTLWIGILIELIRTTNKWARMLHGIMLVPVCISFLLTLSRGALIVLPIVAILILLLFKLKQQVLMLLYSILALGLSLVLYTHLENVGTEVYHKIQEANAQQLPFDTKSVFSSPSIGSWVLIAVVSIIMTFIVIVITKYVDPYLTKKINKLTISWSNIIVPCILFVIVLIGIVAITSDFMTQLLPSVIRSRVENINLQTHSVYERLTMYGDAIRMSKQNPIIGAGAGGWDALYERYQSYSYISGQTHGYLTQLLVEVGILGLIVYLSVIGIVLYSFIHFYRKSNESERIKMVFYFMVPITVLIHSLIDFEMSYILYSVLVFLCLGVLAGTQRQRIVLKLNKATHLKLKWAGFVLTSILVIVVAVSSGNQLYAVNKFEESQKAIINKQPFNEIVEPLENGLNKAPGHPALLYQYSFLNYSAYEQTQDTNYLQIAQDYMKQLNDKEPNYRQSVELGYMISESLGKKNATEILLDGVRRYPYEQALYDQAAATLLKKWEDLRKENNSEADIVSGSIDKLYNEMIRREKIIQDLPDTIGLLRTIVLSNTVRLAVGKIRYDEQDYEKVEQLLKTGIKDDISKEEDRIVARYYLASLLQQGKDDEALHQKLSATDPNEEGEIQTLLSK
ncbi:O-antigen ligase family protein [Cohnella lupini]|uniref:O-antigen ligase n=1 Tax=Cohnella lupini TaxID=1294267 RepID=A0A3D9I7C0_9BACL|nr:O-antigen ligase family protein [Cohnella lupini]RED57647.1 O-antigen ligase [Cohnella lupini]